MITDKDLFFFPTTSVARQRTRGQDTQERSTMKISYVEINSSHRRLQFRRSKRKYYRMRMTRVDKRLNEIVRTRFNLERKEETKEGIWEEGMGR